MRLALSCWVLASYLLWDRFFIGVDFTDEAYYVAQAYVFTLGTRPYLDEILFTQSAFVPLAPLVAIYQKVVGSLDGIILFFRCCFLILMGAGTTLFYRVLRSSLSQTEALIACLVIFLFWPFGIPSLSYNTIGMLAMAMAALLGMGSFSNTRSVVVLFLMVAVWIYPTFLLAALLIAFLSFRSRDWSSPWEKWATLLLGTLVAVCAAYFFLGHVGLDRVLQIYDYAKSDGQHLRLAQKALQVINQIKTDILFLGGLTAAFVLSLWVARRRPSLSVAVLVPVVFLLNWVPLWGMATPPSHAILIALFVSVLPSVIARCRRPGPDVADLLVIVGCVAGATTGLTSANGLTNVPIGMLSGIVGVFLCLGREFRRSGRAGHEIAFCVMCIGVLIIQLRDLRHPPYWDGPASELKRTIRSGPYQGLRTSQRKEDFLRSVHEDLNGMSGSIAFFDSFPAGYLLGPRPMAAPTVFPVSHRMFPIDRGALATAYALSTPWPDTLVWMNTVPLNARRSYEVRPEEEDPVRRLLLPHYAVHIVRADYTIYRRK